MTQNKLNLPEFLRCIKCKSNNLSENETALCCQNCNAEYPIKMGIPILMDKDNLLETKKELQSYYDDESTSYNITHGSELYGTEYNLDTHYQKIFDKYVPKDGNVLEFGSGTGRFSSVFKGMCKNICLTDFSINMLLSNTEKDLPKMCADTEVLPVADETFDFCVGMTTFSYLPNKIAGMKELWRVLKPGGRLLIIDQNSDRVILKFANLYYLRHRERNRQPQNMESNIPFLTGLMEQAKFKIDDKGYFSWIPHALPKYLVTLLRPFDFLLTKTGFLKKYAMRIYITGVK